MQHIIRDSELQVFFALEGWAGIRFSKKTGFLEQNSVAVVPPHAEHTITAASAQLTMCLADHWPCSFEVQHLHFGPELTPENGAKNQWNKDEISSTSIYIYIYIRCLWFPELSFVSSFQLPADRRLRFAVEPCRATHDEL